jgi:phosphopantetheine--protein transferase-like protein
MTDIAKVRSVVSRFFQVSEAEIDDAFAFPPRRLQGSLARTTFRSAILRLAHVDLPSAMTAATFGELVAGIDAGTNSRDEANRSPIPHGHGVTARPSRASPSAVAMASRAPHILTGIDVESAGSLPWNHDAVIAEAFFHDHFTPAELAHARARPESELSLLGLWAAKEAVLKCGWAGLLQPRHVEIVFGPDGKPGVSFSAECRSLALQAGVGAPDSARHSISISHTTGIAVAVCVRLA